jgi:hypothetical protein
MDNETIQVLEEMQKHEADSKRNDALQRAIYALQEADDLDRASGKLQRDYWDDVRGLAESIEAEIATGEITCQDDLQERLHEDCDGAARVIYTHQAKLCLVFSDNDDAYEQEYGGEMPNWSQLAYCAFFRDVQERVDPTVCDDCGDKFATKEHDGDDVCQDCFEERIEDEEEDNE